MFPIQYTVGLHKLIIMMAHQIENYGVNGTLLSLNTSSLKEEPEEDVDDKVYVSETVIIPNNFELQDRMKWHVKIEEHETSSILDDIKAELPSSKGQYNIINDNVQIEEGIRAKIEFNNGLLYCEHCQAYYEDYCIKCGMLVHILNRNAPDNLDNRTQDELPNDILEIQHLFVQCGILALKVIPEGVTFGPFTGIYRTECTWKIKGGKFIADKDRSRYLNWMQYINPARNTFEGNLIVLQCEDYIYYRSTRQILSGEELLVYFGEDLTDRLSENVEMDFIPTIEHLMKDVFACTFCCLGFSSKSYLAKHKTICLGDTRSYFSFEDLIQCPFCKIHFGQKEYLEHDFDYCSERRNVRKQTLSNQMTAGNGRRTSHRPLYKCVQCSYRTKYQGVLNKHINKQHYKVNKFNCGICYGRFKTKEHLRLHIENTHISVGGVEDPAHSKCDYDTTSIKLEQSNSRVQRETFECSRCSLRTQYRQSLTRHMETKHSMNFNNKCDSCEFKTIHKDSLESHIKTQHLKECDFKCDSCEYETNLKHSLESHIKTKHLKERNFKCDSCEYETTVKHSLKTHIKTIHLKQFDYKCDLCEFRTNYRNKLERHRKSTHLKEFHLKCDTCEFTTNCRNKLERHTKSTHLGEFDFKCDSCEFRTNHKHDLRRHVKSKHLKEFNFKCDSCTFKANRKDHLKSHIKNIHLKELDLKCDSCEFSTNYKSVLKIHIKSKHLKEFDFKCDSCEYRTNHRGKLEIHVKAKHLKECNYKRDVCEFRTNRKDLLESHIKSKHLIVFDFKCGLCQYETHLKHNLDRHTKRNHLT